MNLIHGVDLSKWNAILSPAGLRARGARFVMARASYGRTPDPRFAAHLAVAEGLGRGAYHWLDEDVDLDEQLRAFFGVAAQPYMVDQRPLVLALDVEPPPGRVAFKNPRRMACMVRCFLEELPDRPLLYLSPSTAAQFQAAELDSLAEISRLWIAHYGVSAPHVPAAWPRYTIWQTGTAAGIDQDVFNGDEAAFAELFGGVP